MSEVRKELWRDEDYRERTEAHLRDKKQIRDRAKKYSATYQGVSVDEWKGFITKETTLIRGSEEYKSWRERVFARDDYTCQCCGARSKAGEPVELRAHHLDSFAQNEEKRFDVDNGVTLCKKCHDVGCEGSFHNLYGTLNITANQYFEYVDNCAQVRELSM